MMYILTKDKKNNDIIEISDEFYEISIFDDDAFKQEWDAIASHFYPIHVPSQLKISYEIEATEMIRWLECYFDDGSMFALELYARDGRVLAQNVEYFIHPGIDKHKVNTLYWLWAYLKAFDIQYDVDGDEKFCIQQQQWLTSVNVLGLTKIQDYDNSTYELL